MATQSSAKTPSQKIPLDVLGYIADMLGADRRHAPQCWYYKDTLIQLSLTCKFMVPICHRHLFSNINFLSFRRNLRWRNSRSEFLLSHPTIATHYVKNVALDASQAKFSTSEYDLLRRICDTSSLASVHISTGNWNKLPEETKSVILSLIQIPTLRHLTLEKINNFPAAALSLCCGPIDIALHDIDRLAPPSADYAMQNPKITSLESLNCSIDGTLAALLGHIGQNEAGAIISIIAFDRLRDASFEISTQSEVTQTCKFLEKATCLEKLRIRVLRRKAWPVWIGSGLAANPRPKLRCFILDIDGDFNEEDGDSILDEINHELRKISAKNVLEVLEVHIKINFLGTRNGPLWDWTA